MHDELRLNGSATNDHLSTMTVPNRRVRRFSRSAWYYLAALAVIVGTFGIWLYRANQRLFVIREIQTMRAGVNYTVVAPWLLRQWFGDDRLTLFRHVTRIDFARSGCSNAKLLDLSELGGLADDLYSLDLRDSEVTDAGLRHLYGFQQLRSVNLAGTKVTEAGISDLQRALPRLKVDR